MFPAYLIFEELLPPPNNKRLHKEDSVRQCAVLKAADLILLFIIYMLMHINWTLLWSGVPLFPFSIPPTLFTIRFTLFGKKWREIHANISAIAKFQAIRAFLDSPEYTYIAVSITIL